MGPLWVAMTALAACYMPNDGTPGWKQVALPDDAPALAAPEGVEQFRPGEPVTVVESRSRLYRSGEHQLGGKTIFEFTLGEGGRSLDVWFEAPLRGAKVDVWAWGPGGSMTLMQEAWVGGDQLSLSWGENEVRSVTVRVHQHLREAPLLAAFRSVKRVKSEALSESAAFRLGRSLYYRQPLGPRVRLCDAPGRVLSVGAEAVPTDAKPMAVSLERTAEEGR